MPNSAETPGGRALAVFAGRASDYNDRAMPGARVLGDGEVVGLEIAEFETGTGDDTAAAEALLDALAPLVDEVPAVGAAAV